MACVNTVNGPQSIHRSVLDLLADQVMSTIAAQPDSNVLSDCQLLGESFFFSSRQRRCECDECKAYRRVLGSL
jgi:hypothetical protein